MRYRLWAWIGSRNHGLDGVQIPYGKGQFWGKGAPTVKYRDFLPWAVCKNSCTDWDAIWVAESGGPKEPHIRCGYRSPWELGNFVGAGHALTCPTTLCPYTLQWDAHFPPKISPFPWGDLDPHLIHGSPGPPKSSTQTAARSVQPFLQGSVGWQTDRQTTLLGR